MCSINTDLVKSYDFVTSLLDDGLLVDFILLDQAKAFDKVHQFLPLKMEAYRVHEDIVEWIESFLTGRMQRVVVYDATSKTVYSDEIPVISRVSQGIILGPTLFSIYINDCTTYLKNPLTLYADDYKLFSFFSKFGKHICISFNLINWD